MGGVGEGGDRLSYGLMAKLGGVVGLLVGIFWLAKLGWKLDYSLRSRFVTSKENCRVNKLPG
ncbi:hypothetical protein [Pedobacter sp. NJ-S-72]